MRPRPPIGIHPSPYSAMCSNSFGPAAPPMRTGGPLRCAGFGHCHVGSNWTYSPSKLASSLVHSSRMARTCSRALARRRAVVDAVVVHLVLVPTEADAERETATGEEVERGGGLCGDDRIVLRDEEDAGADAEARRCHRRGGERDERVEAAAVLVGQLAAVGVGRASARRDVGVLGDPDRVEAALFDRLGQLDHADRHVGDEHRDAVSHRVESSRPTIARHDLRGPGCDRDRGRARHRARARARVRTAGRGGRGERHRCGARRYGRVGDRRRTRWSRRSSTASVDVR